MPVPPAPTPRRPTARLLGTGALALLALLGASCTDDGGDGTATTGPGDAPATGGADLASVEALAAELEAAGHPCALEYEGLRDGDKELSLCTVGGEQITLSIWFDTAQLDAFRDSPPGGAPGVTVIGGNWTIDLADPTLAQELAADLDAEVRAG